jgi:DNA mismatch repair protein MutL
MARCIQVLSDVVANQIAAGEIVERPASVVKELVENALDARASRVEIAIERGGKRRIRVSDDGGGMGREDALLSLDRHATSKIAAAGDLQGIRTFGFRGEALPSIAAVSQLTLDTREAEEDIGTRVLVDGGQINAVEDLPRRRGTTVEVRNLFYNAPARSKFLKSVSAESRVISEATIGLALANPKVAFVLTSDDRTLLDLAVVDDAAARIAQVWGADQGSTLILASNSDNGFDLKGLVQRPDAVKPGVRRSYLFVNGRPFRAPQLVKAAERGYRTTIPQGVRPWIFFYLQVPKGHVDVNVHPAKVEVRFKEWPRIEMLVEDAVRDALEGEESSATFDAQLTAPPLVVREGSAAPLAPAADAQMALFMAGAQVSDDMDPGTATSVPELEPGAARPRLWQVLDTYILAETRDGILILDQHSAHERVLFQRLMESFERGGQEGQRLLFPLTIRLTPSEIEQVVDLGGLLERAGFEVEPFGGDTVIVHAVPNPHRYFDAERAFREMVEELTHGSELVRSAKNQHERIAMTFACKGAIKAGQKLSGAEMQELFDELFATDLHHHDVHGRPTVVRLSGGELARKFGRT